jgi:hypothetical protein
MLYSFKQNRKLFITRFMKERDSALEYINPFYWQHIWQVKKSSSTVKAIRFPKCPRIIKGTAWIKSDRRSG